MTLAAHAAIDMPASWHATRARSDERLAFNSKHKARFQSDRRCRAAFTLPAAFRRAAIARPTYEMSVWRQNPVSGICRMAIPIPPFTVSGSATEPIAEWSPDSSIPECVALERSCTRSMRSTRSGLRRLNRLTQRKFNRVGPAHHQSTTPESQSGLVSRLIMALSAGPSQIQLALIATPRSEVPFC